ncbi:MAG: hypothetical protein K940chlam3_01721 [Chlamydiae bacterium]|nr:hypothetical protein [Chlamydiota bacterium]
MKAIASLTGIYGLIVIGGGLMGYFIAGSTASIISGSLFGFLMILCGLGIHKNFNFALHAASIISFILTVIFIYRYAITKSWIPAGIMMLLSIVVFASTLFAYKIKTEEK